ncbi:MAG: Ig-like domain repeat protein, partial [Acidobacteriota bacterium]
NHRRRLSAALVITLLSLVAVAALSADVAAAARYTVAQCGWHVGHDAAWFDTSANKFVRSSYCRTPQSASGFDGVHLTSETRGSTRTVGGTRFARWRWQAPAGTGIVTVHGHRWQILRDNFQHRIGSVGPSGGFTPFTEFKTTDTVRRDFNHAFSPHATAIESRLLCARPADRVCDASKRSLAGVRALSITIDDSIRPTSSVSGGLTGSGWLRGIQTLSFSDRDAGSGLRYAQTSIDGAVRGHTELACSKALIAGQWRATRMLPCPTAGSGGHSIATATLGDGAHRLRHCGVDFAGNSGCAADRTIRVDNNPPAAPRSLEVTGGGGWRKGNGFDLTWTDPGQGAAAPIVAHRFRVTGSGGFDTGPGNFDTGPLSGFGSGSITGALVPRSGEYLVSVWLIDAAGNQTETASASVTLRFDDVPPSGYFTEPDPERPEIVRVPVADSHSGPALGVIAYRRQGAAGWHELPTSIAGPGSSRQLIARFPGDELDPGVYEFRARIVDRAGNTAVTTARGNGSAMTLSAPRRTATALTARLDGPATNRSGDGAGRSGLTVRIPFGRMARLSGRLTTSGGALSSQPVRVTETPASGAAAGVSVTTVRTGGDGRFRLELPRGTSRTVSVKFRGGERYGDSSVGPLDLQVAGSIRFRARPRRLRTGRRVRLRGRVRAGAARTPGRGNPVAIQYLERAAKRWRPVLVTRTDRRGRFRAGYRFRYITGRARIRLRAVLLDSRFFPYATAHSRPVTVWVKGPAR